MDNWNFYNSLSSVELEVQILNIILSLESFLKFNTKCELIVFPVCYICDICKFYMTFTGGAMFNSPIIAICEESVWIN